MTPATCLLSICCHHHHHRLSRNPQTCRAPSASVVTDTHQSLSPTLSQVTRQSPHQSIFSSMPPTISIQTTLYSLADMLDLNGLASTLASDFQPSPHRLALAAPSLDKADLTKQSSTRSTTAKSLSCGNRVTFPDAYLIPLTRLDRSSARLSMARVLSWSVERQGLHAWAEMVAGFLKVLLVGLVPLFLSRILPLLRRLRL